VKLDKRHLVASLALLLGSVVYNLWVFMAPSPLASGGAGGVQPATIAAGSDEGAGGMAALDATQIPAAPDVEPGRLPDWSRDPFAHVRPESPAVADTSPVAPPSSVEPDVALAAILYSADRQVAMVNGRVVRPGDKLGGVTIVDILSNGIVVESEARGRRTLALKLPGSIVEPQ
jgi:hypothetical protein